MPLSFVNEMKKNLIKTKKIPCKESIYSKYRMRKTEVNQRSQEFKNTKYQEAKYKVK